MTNPIKLTINLFKPGSIAPSRAQSNPTPRVIILKGAWAGIYSSTNRLDDAGGHILKIAGEKRLNLPRQLMSNKSMYDDSPYADLEIIRLHVYNDSVDNCYEFCCTADFPPVATKILSLVLTGTAFSGRFLGAVHPVAVKGTAVPPGKTVQVIISSEPLIGTYYLQAYVIGEATRATHFRLQPLPRIDSRSDYFDLVKVMAKRSLIAVPVIA
jgi:hypothetical protein